MNRKDVLQKLKTDLLFRRDSMRGALRLDLEVLTELANATGDLAQSALESAHERITSQLAEVESRELSKIEKAIERMNDGRYGECEGCCRAIPLARLRALPYAALCIGCQEKLEESGCQDWSELANHAYDSLRSHNAI
jgi:DnaK suppressor protein